MANQEIESHRAPVGLARLSRLLGIPDKGLSFWELLSIAAFTIGTLTIMTYAAPYDGKVIDSQYLVRSGTLFAAGAGAWMCGGALGFLFGIPRYKSATETSNIHALSPSAQTVVAFTPNTNLEQISDWLTKIIVGATLVQVKSLAAGFAEMCVWMGDQLHRPSAAIFCGGIVLFFFFAGFLWGYLWCSIRIYRELVKLTSQLQAGS